MIVDEQIQSSMISFELTKPNHSNVALLVPWSWSSTFFVNLGFFEVIGVGAHEWLNHNTASVSKLTKSASQIQNSFIKG